MNAQRVTPASAAGQAGAVAGSGTSAGTRQAGDPAPLPLRVVDFSLEQALSASPAGADPSVHDLLRVLRTQTPPAVAGGWLVYLQTPLARLYERQAGQGGFAHGMAAMLVLPARGLEEFRGAGCSVFDVEAATVIGASLPDAGGTGTRSLPRLYGFDATRLETDWRPPQERHWQAMSLPLLLPGWRAVPGQGLHAGWQALMAQEGSTERTLVEWLEQVAHQFRASLWAPTRRALLGSHGADEVDMQLDRLSVTLTAAEQAVARTAVQAFMGHLDTLVVQGCIARRGALRPAEYNWVADGATARAWQWRMEALEIFPGLCTSAVPPTLPIQVPTSMTRRSAALRRLKRWAEDPAVRGAYTLCEAVDQGLPLVRHLARTFSIKPVAIRALRGVGAGDVALLQAPPLGWPDLLRALDAIAPERHPRTPVAWQGFTLLYTEALHAWRVVHSLNIGLGQRFMVDVLRPWLARAGRDWDFAATRWRDGFQRVDGLHVAAAWGQDLKTLMASPGVPAEQRQQIVEALSRAPLPLWQRMVEEREAWQPPEQPLPREPPHPEPAPGWWWRGMRDAALPQEHAGPWHRLEKEVSLDVGLTVTPLHSVDRLRREADKMQHCIHTYTRQIASMPQLAFALGDDGAGDRSTALLGYRRGWEGGWHVQVLQHKAVRNRPTSPACDAALNRLVLRLTALETRDAMDRVEHARVLRLQAMQAAGTLVEPPWRADARAAAARRAEHAAAQAETVLRALHVLRRAGMACQA